MGLDRHIQRVRYFPRAPSAAAEHGYSPLFFDDYNGYPAIDHGSEPFYSRYWWPCNDIPADKADSFDIKITIDTGLTAVNNGLMISDIDNGDGTHTSHWKVFYDVGRRLYKGAAAAQGLTNLRYLPGMIKIMHT